MAGLVRVPLFQIPVDETLSKIIESEGIVLSEGKTIRSYDHSKEGNGWEEHLYAKSDPRYSNLKNVKFAIYLNEPDSGTPETIILFMKIIKDCLIDVDCWFSDNQTNKIRNIQLRDGRTTRTPRLNDRNWEWLQYSKEDFDMLQKLCTAYFDKILPRVLAREECLLLLLSINYARVAFSEGFSDPRLSIPLLGTSIECLFSSKKYEVAHRVGENLAWFLEPDNNERRKNMYQAFQNFYEIRSEIIHDGFTKKDGARQIESYQFASDVIKNATIKILSSDKFIEIYKSKTSKTDFFTNLILTKDLVLNTRLGN